MGERGFSVRTAADRLAVRELKKNANIAGFGILLSHGFSFAVAYGVYYVAGLFVYGRMNGTAYDIFENAGSLLAYVAGLAVPIALMVYWIRIPAYAAFPMKKPRAPLVAAGVFFCLGVSVAGMFLSAFTGAFVQAVSGLNPVMPDMTMPRGGIALALYWVNITLAPAFLEEMMFRGVIMQSLRRFGDGFALVVSSILFSMVHGNLVQGPNAFLMGLAIGYFVLRTGSLWTGVIIHFVNNGIAVAADFIIRALPETYAGTVNLAIFFLYVTGGLISLVFLLARGEGLLKLAPSPMRIPEGRKYTAFFLTLAQILLFIVTVFFTVRYLEG